LIIIVTVFGGDAGAIDEVVLVRVNSFLTSGLPVKPPVIVIGVAGEACSNNDEVPLPVDGNLMATVSLLLAVMESKANPLGALNVIVNVLPEKTAVPSLTIPTFGKHFPISLLHVVPSEQHPGP
jgi:hypothetical protein